MTNKYLEKIAGFGLPGSIGKRVAVGAGVGAATGAIAGGKDNRLKGAIAGAAVGGIAGSVFGRKPPSSPSSSTAVSNVFGKGTSTSPLAAKLKATTLKQKYMK